MTEEHKDVPGARDDRRGHSTRFRKGVSGNPAGRPVGARGRRQILDAVARELHPLEQGGVTQFYSMVELILLQLRKHMFERPQQGFKAVHGYLKRYGPQEAAEGGGYLVAPERLTLEEFVAAGPKTLAYQEKQRAYWYEKLGLNKVVPPDR
jgi:hypothetical protein